MLGLQLGVLISGAVDHRAGLRHPGLRQADLDAVVQPRLPGDPGRRAGHGARLHRRQPRWSTSCYSRAQSAHPRRRRCGMTLERRRHVAATRARPPAPPQRSPGAAPPAASALAGVVRRVVFVLARCSPAARAATTRPPRTSTRSCSRPSSATSGHRRPRPRRALQRRLRRPGLARGRRAGDAARAGGRRPARARWRATTAAGRTRSCPRVSRRHAGLPVPDPRGRDGGDPRAVAAQRRRSPSASPRSAGSCASTRGEVLALREQEFVRAAVANGAGDR